MSPFLLLLLSLFYGLKAIEESIINENDDEMYELPDGQCTKKYECFVINSLDTNNGYIIHGFNLSSYSSLCLSYDIYLDGFDNSDNLYIQINCNDGNNKFATNPKILRCPKRH